MICNWNYPTSYTIQTKTPKKCGHDVVWALISTRGSLVWSFVRPRAQSTSRQYLPIFDCHTLLAGLLKDINEYLFFFVTKNFVLHLSLFFNVLWYVYKAIVPKIHRRTLSRNFWRKCFCWSEKGSAVSEFFRRLAASRATLHALRILFTSAKVQNKTFCRKLSSRKNVGLGWY